MSRSRNVGLLLLAIGCASVSLQTPKSDLHLPPQTSQDLGQQELLAVTPMPLPDHLDHVDEPNLAELESVWGSDGVRSLSSPSARALVVNISHPGSPAIPISDAASAARGAADIIHAVSRGMVTVDVSVFPNDVVVPGVGDPCAEYGVLSQQATDQIRSTVNLADYRFLTFMFSVPGSRCAGWVGMGTITGTHSWIVRPSAQVVAHEWGHNAGLSHLSAVRCSRNGEPIPFLSRSERQNCETSVYGGPFSLMGGANTATITFAERSQLGWLRPGEEFGVESGTYALGIDGPTALLWVQNSEGDLFTIEFVRASLDTAFGKFFDPWTYKWTPIGDFPDWTHAGVMVRHVTSFWFDPMDGTSSHSGSVIDMNPRTIHSTDAALRQGQTWTDTTGSLSVEVLESSGDSATVRVNGAPISVPAPAIVESKLLGKNRLSLTLKPPPQTPKGTKFLVQIANDRRFRKPHSVMLNGTNEVVRLPASLSRSSLLRVQVSSVSPSIRGEFGIIKTVSRAKRR